MTACERCGYRDCICARMDEIDARNDRSGSTPYEARRDALGRLARAFDEVRAAVHEFDLASLAYAHWLHGKVVK